MQIFALGLVNVIKLNWQSFASQFGLSTFWLFCKFYFVWIKLCVCVCVLWQLPFILCYKCGYCFVILLCPVAETNIQIIFFSPNKGQTNIHTFPYYSIHLMHSLMFFAHLSRRVEIGATTHRSMRGIRFCNHVGRRLILTVPKIPLTRAPGSHRMLASGVHGKRTFSIAEFSLAGCITECIDTPVWSIHCHKLTTA